MDPFKYVAEFNTIVYKECGAVVLASQVEAHLRRPRHQMSATDRHTVIKAVGKIKGLIYTKEQLTERFERLEGPARAVQHLPIHTDGFACEKRSGGERCLFVCRSEDVIKRYYRTVHGWVNHQPKGGSLA